MRAVGKILIIVVSLAAAAPLARAQNPITTITLGPDQIGVVKTAPGITTKISFPDKVTESICGDLYDASSGKGTFVIQPSGNDLFLKPIASKGMSNLFVKTGDGGKRTYNFDLQVVTIAQAHRVVNVVEGAAQSVEPARDSQTAPQSTATPEHDSAPSQPAAGPPVSSTEKPTGAEEAERIKAEAEQAARKTADEIIRNARQQADRIVGEAETKVADLDRQAAERGAQEVGRRFAQAMMLGLREAKINNPRAASKKVIVTLDPRVLSFDEKSYLRYTIQNAGSDEFSFNAITLEAGTGEEAQPVTIEIVQSKAENKLESGESLAGVISFDAKAVGPKDRLTLYVRGEENAELARVNIR